VGHDQVDGLYTKYTIFVRNTAGNLHLYFRDTTVTGNDRNIGTGAYTFSTTSSRLTADFNIRSVPTKTWVAGVQTIADSLQQAVIAYHYNFDGIGVPTFNSAVDITTVSYPTHITIMYVSDSSFYLAAMYYNGQTSVYVVTGSGTGSPSVVNKIMATQTSATWFEGESTGTVIVTVGNIIGAEDVMLTKSQVIITKSDLSLDVTLYNCYAITNADDNTIVDYQYTQPTQSVAVTNFNEQSKAQVNSDTSLTSSTLFVRRVASATGECV
jgi:hypothetical protein